MEYLTTTSWKTKGCLCTPLPALDLRRHSANHACDLSIFGGLFLLRYASSLLSPFRLRSEVVVFKQRRRTFDPDLGKLSLLGQWPRVDFSRGILGGIGYEWCLASSCQVSKE